MAETRHLQSIMKLERQWQSVELLKRGWSRIEIAQELGCDLRSVNRYIDSAMKIFKVHQVRGLEDLRALMQMRYEGIVRIFWPIMEGEATASTGEELIVPYEARERACALILKAMEGQAKMWGLNQGMAQDMEALPLIEIAAKNANNEQLLNSVRGLLGGALPALPEGVN